MFQFLASLFRRAPAAPPPSLPPAPPRPTPVKLVLTHRAAALARRAAPYGWRVREEQRNIALLILDRGDEQANIYYSKMTVGTVVTHPKHGRTQMFRRNVTDEQLDAILRTPRAHLNTGYRRTEDRRTT